MKNLYARFMLWVISPALELAKKKQASEAIQFLDVVRGKRPAMDLTGRERNVLAIAEEMDKQAITKMIDSARRARVI